MVEIDALARSSAEVAVRILSGETAGTLTHAPRPLSAPTFDASELARWRISESRLPEGSVVRFRQPTAWQRYRTPIIAVVGIVLAQTALVVGLVTLNVKRKRADRLRQESEARFRLLVDTAPVMIWMSGEDANCTDFNRAWLEFRGRTLEQESGSGWVSGVHEGDVDAALKTYYDAFERREPFRMEYRLRRFDGEYRWVLDSGAPRFTVDGTFVGYTGSAVDVTEHKLAKAALSALSQTLLRAQEEERARIAREIHDDIGQRLAALSIDLGGLQQRLSENDADVDRTFTDVLHQFAALGSDAQALSHRLHSSKLELLGLSQATASFCRELAAQRRVTIHYTESGIVPHLPSATAVGLFRVMQEAVVNAVQHSGSSDIDVTLTGTGSCVELTVVDQGVGFDDRHVQQTRGLGLVSMRERVGLMGGRLHVESRPGSGTSIRASIPVVTASV
jgi:PAS domain S-box-containing protein